MTDAVSETIQPEYTREKIIAEIKLILGGGLVDVELDPEHFNVAVSTALDRYRQRSGNALEESFLFLMVQPEVSVYTLPSEVQEVRDIYRRTMGGTAGGGIAVDPFSLAFTNNLYLIQNPAGSGSGSGTMALYDMAAQYQTLVGRLFGRDVMFTWNRSSHKLMLHRKFTGREEICLHVYNTRPETALWNDPGARPWLRDYATAKCKMMLGEAYSKFGSLAGPQGGVSLKGDALKAEAQAELERLESEAFNLFDADQGYGFIIG
jgi:hypothetical protein